MARLLFRVHAVRRMSQRCVSVDDVVHVLQSGLQIAEVPSGRGGPVRVILGWSGSLITVYEPDPRWWNADFRRRRA